MSRRRAVPPPAPLPALRTTVAGTPGCPARRARAAEVAAWAGSALPPRPPVGSSGHRERRDGPLPRGWCSREHQLPCVWKLLRVPCPPRRAPGTRPPRSSSSRLAEVVSCLKPAGSSRLAPRKQRVLLPTAPAPTPQAPCSEAAFSPERLPRPLRTAVCLHFLPPPKLGGKEPPAENRQPTCPGPRSSGKPASRFQSSCVMEAQDFRAAWLPGLQPCHWDMVAELLDVCGPWAWPGEAGLEAGAPAARFQ